ncbi:MAG: hypothetical protein ABSG53_22105 [Thermoguttaceae bacterium]|jgi:hypothetical protein
MTRRRMPQPLVDLYGALPDYYRVISSSTETIAEAIAEYNAMANALNKQQQHAILTWITTPVRGLQAFDFKHRLFGWSGFWARCLDREEVSRQNDPHDCDEFRSGNVAAPI